MPGLRLGEEAGLSGLRDRGGERQKYPLGASLGVSALGGRSRACMLAAYRFFKHLGSAEGTIRATSLTAITGEHWAALEEDVERMEEALGELAACYPGLPADKLGRLLARARDAVRRKSYWDAWSAVDDLRFYLELELSKRPLG